MSTLSLLNLHSSSRDSSLASASDGNSSAEYGEFVELFHDGREAYMIGRMLDIGSGLLASARGAVFDLGRPTEQRGLRQSEVCPLGAHTQAQLS